VDKFKETKGHFLLKSLLWNRCSSFKQTPNCTLFNINCDIFLSSASKCETFATDFTWNLMTCLPGSTHVRQSSLLPLQPTAWYNTSTICFASSEVGNFVTAALLCMIARLNKGSLTSESKWSMTDWAPALFPKIVTCPSSAFVKWQNSGKSSGQARPTISYAVSLFNWIFMLRHCLQTHKVTWFLSPPNFSMFCWIHSRASCWSFQPWFPSYFTFSSS